MSVISAPRGMVVMASAPTSGALRRVMNSSQSAMKSSPAPAWA